jgi:hypothetical protein
MKNIGSVFFLKNVVTFSRNVENNKQQVYMGFGGL